MRSPGLLWLVLAAAGCGQGDYPAGSRRAASDPIPDGGGATLLDESSPYRLPWHCGATIATTQGNRGDLCGEPNSDHVGVQAYAFDFGLERHSDVLAARAGTVTFAVEEVKPGERCYDGCPDPATFDACCRACVAISNHVNVEHDDGTVATYWHLDAIAVREGDRVAAGDRLGWSGTSGCSTGPHLHFQVMRGCPAGWCQSLPISFADAGKPACGVQVTSRNSCQ